MSGKDTAGKYTVPMATSTEEYGDNLEEEMLKRLSKDPHSFGKENG